MTERFGLRLGRVPKKRGPVKGRILKYGITAATIGGGAYLVAPTQFHDTAAVLALSRYIGNNRTPPPAGGGDGILNGGTAGIENIDVTEFATILAFSFIVGALAALYTNRPHRALA